MELSRDNAVPGEWMAVSSESPLNLVRGPAKKPEWANLIRQGGDRVAVLFEEMRKSLGKVEGIVERLHYAEKDARWVVQYKVGNRELCAVRISPGLLEAEIVLRQEDSDKLSRSLKPGGQDAVVARPGETGLSSVRVRLKDRRTVRLIARLVAVQSKLVSKTTKAVS